MGLATRLCKVQEIRCEWDWWEDDNLLQGCTFWKSCARLCVTLNPFKVGLIFVHMILPHYIMCDVYIKDYCDCTLLTSLALTIPDNAAYISDSFRLFWVMRDICPIMIYMSKSICQRCNLLICCDNPNLSKSMLWLSQTWQHQRHKSSLNLIEKVLYFCFVL